MRLHRTRRYDTFSRHTPRAERRRQLRLAVTLAAVFGLAGLGITATAPREVVAFDAPCGAGMKFARMWELPGFEGDKVVLCSNKTNFAFVSNLVNGVQRVCDGAPDGLNRTTWANCPSSIYVGPGSVGCFSTYIGYTENTLRIIGPYQLTLSGIWANNFESFRWC